MIKLCWTCQNSPGELEAVDLLKAVSETTPDLIRVNDLEGRLLFANRAALKEIGKPAREVIGRREAEYARDPQQSDLIMRVDQRVMETGNPEEVEERFTGPNGTKIYLSRKTPLRDAGGKIIGLVVTSADITTRKNAEELERRSRAEMKRASEIKDQFLAIVSHELRTPLTAILAWAHLLASDRCPESSKTEISRRLLQDAQTQSQIVDDLLDMTKIAAGSLHLAPRTVDGISAIGACVERFRQAAAEKNISIEFEEPDRFELFADPRRLDQILANLLSNAIKFTPPGGEIVVDVRLEAEAAAVSVTDDGTGIAADILPHVFNRFTQADSSATRRYKGLGLGLALVKTLTELHGGTVEARSAGIGHGASFTVRLPRAGELPQTAYNRNGLNIGSDAASEGPGSPG